MTEHPIKFDALAEAMRAHSIFAPSSSEMWLTCSGSLIPNILAPDQAGEDAAYGTVGHLVGEIWGNTGKRPDEMVGTVQTVTEGEGDKEEIFWIIVDDEMLDYVERYVEWCNELGGDHYVEQRVYFDQLTPIPHQGGTADHAACEWEVLTITDLKMGKGVQVFARENTQAMLYALGFFYEWDWLYNFQRIVIRIAQPRLDHFDVWETTRERLLEFAEHVRVRAAAAWVPDAPRSVSPKGCRWCKVHRTCPAFLTAAERLVDEVFGAIEDPVSTVQMDESMKRLELDTFLPEAKLKPPRQLKTEHLAKLLPYWSMFEAFFKGVWAEAERRAYQGEKITNYKLVEGRTTRSFIDEKRVEKALTSVGGIDSFMLFSMNFISPAQSEALLVKFGGMKRKDAKLLVAKFVSKAAGKPTLAPVDDSRREYVSPADDAFETFED